MQRKRIITLFMIMLSISLTVFFLFGCLPSNLVEGYNKDPRTMKTAENFTAHIYVKNGLALPYRLYSPTSEEGKTYPILLLLHGSGKSGIDNNAQLYPSLTKSLMSYRQDLGEFYLLVPQIAKNTNWDSYLEGKAGNVLFAALDDIIAKEPNIDTSRQYIGGVSLGGFGTITALSLAPERFAAAFSICGGNSAHWEENYVEDTSLYARLAKTPLILAHGKKDTIVDYNYSKEIFDNVTTLNGIVRLETFSDMEHNIWNKCFETQEYWNWLFSHTRA